MKPETSNQSGTPRIHSWEDVKFRDRVRMALGLRPVESFDPRAFRGAVRRSWLVFNVPADRLEINPVGGCRLAPCPDPYATSGGYRREDWLR